MSPHTEEKMAIGSGLTSACEYLKGRCWENGARLLTVVPSDRRRGNEHKLETRKFYLNIRKDFFSLKVTEHWKRLSWEAVDSSFPGDVQDLSGHSPVRPALSQLAVIGRVNWTDLQRSLSSPVILCFQSEFGELFVQRQKLPRKP